MIYIFVIAKNDYFIKTIQAPLLSDHQIKIVKICRQIEHAVNMYREHEYRTGIVLMDINWNRHTLSGIQLLQQLLECNPALRVIGFTNSYEWDIAKKWKDAGGWAYVYRTIEDVNEIAACIKKVHNGEHYFAEKKDAAKS